MRKDGRVIKTMDPEYQIMAHILAERYDSMNMARVDVPCDPIQEFINRHRGDEVHYSHIAIYMAAYVRACAKYPLLNRFVVNKRIYARNNVTVGMVVLKPGSVHGTMNKIHFELTDTLTDVQKKVDAYISQNRGDGITNSTDQLVAKLLRVPGLARVGVNLFKWLDKHGLLPQSVIDASPFHCSMSITNLASIRTGYIYHHIYNFGTTSLFLSLGSPVEVPKRVKGEIQFVRSTPIGIVMDERVADGCEFSIAQKYMQSLFADPEKLLLPPDEVVEDIP